jgi:hypothetical protein
MNQKNMKFVVKLKKPVCRTPIKPVQIHKSDKKVVRKFKHKSKIVGFYSEELKC